MYKRQEEYYIRTKTDEFVLKAVEKGEQFNKYTAVLNVEELDVYKRQFISVKELYDNRDKYRSDTKLLASAASSMLLKEIYGGAAQ